MPENHGGFNVVGNTKTTVIPDGESRRVESVWKPVSKGSRPTGTVREFITNGTLRFEPCVAHMHIGVKVESAVAINVDGLVFAARKGEEDIPSTITPFTIPSAAEPAVLNNEEVITISIDDKNEGKGDVSLWVSNNTGGEVTLTFSSINWWAIVVS